VADLFALVVDDELTFDAVVVLMEADTEELFGFETEASVTTETELERDEGILVDDIDELLITPALGKGEIILILCNAFSKL